GRLAGWRGRPAAGGIDRRPGRWSWRRRWLAGRLLRGLLRRGLGALGWVGGGGLVGMGGGGVGSVGWGGGGVLWGVGGGVVAGQGGPVPAGRLPRARGPVRVRHRST